MNPADATTMGGMLFTDQYQLTMAQVYFREGIHERPAQFDYFFRSYPDYGKHQAGYCVFAGLGWLLDWMEQVRFLPSDLDLLRGQRSGAGLPMFDDAFLGWLEANGNFAGITMRAVSEGRIVHPHVPIVIVEGPLAMAQILETSLLNHLNYQTLIATKASRVREAGRGRPVLDFGMRRGPDSGVNAAARAALIGGADFSSNVGASHVLGFPPKGTHGHSMVQAFTAMGRGELAAFRAFAGAYPDDCTLVVDTIDTLESGIPNAITVFRELREAGHEPAGVRLDSGDLAYLAIRAARLLDDAGFGEVAIVLSSNLDELAIWQILSQIEQEAPRYDVDPSALISRLMYGVGTRLITSQGDSALDGVYKLVAVGGDGEWLPAIKVSESPGKVPTPGDKRVWRVYDLRGNATADVIAAGDETPATGETLRLHHPHEDDTHRDLRPEEILEIEELLVDVWTDGKRVGPGGDISEFRSRRVADLGRLDPGVRRLVNPHIYHVSLTTAIKELRRSLVEAARESID